MLGNGGASFHTVLPNISIATAINLLHINHFHVLLEVDQVATLEHHLYWSALLPMCSLL
jgi:hypothetical protein